MRMSRQSTGVKLSEKLEVEATAKVYFSVEGRALCVCVW